MTLQQHTLLEDTLKQHVSQKVALQKAPSLSTQKKHHYNAKGREKTRRRANSHSVKRRKARQENPQIMKPVQSQQYMHQQHTTAPLVTSAAASTPAYHSPLLNMLLSHHPPQTHQLILNQLDRSSSVSHTRTASQLLELDQELEALFQVWREYGTNAGSPPLGCISQLLEQYTNGKSNHASSNLCHILRETMELDMCQHFAAALENAATSRYQSFTSLLERHSANNLAHPLLYIFHSLQYAFYFHNHIEIRTHVFENALKPRFLPSLHSTGELISLSNIDLHRGELQNLLMREIKWLEREIDMLRELIEKEGIIEFKSNPKKGAKTEDYIQSFNGLVREALSMAEHLDKLERSSTDEQMEEDCVQSVEVNIETVAPAVVEKRKRKKNKKKKKKVVVQQQQEEPITNDSVVMAEEEVPIAEPAITVIEEPAQPSQDNHDDELSDDDASINLKDEGFEYPSSPQHEEGTVDAEAEEVYPTTLDYDDEAVGHSSQIAEALQQVTLAPVSIYGYCAAFSSPHGCPLGETCELKHAAIPEDLQQEWTNQQYFMHDPQQEQLRQESQEIPLPPPAPFHPHQHMMPPPPGSIPPSHPFGSYSLPPVGMMPPPPVPPQPHMQSPDTNYLHSLLIHQHQWIQRLQHSNDLMHQEMMHMRKRMEHYEQMLRMTHPLQQRQDEDDLETPYTSMSDM